MRPRSIACAWMFAAVVGVAASTPGALPEGALTAAQDQASALDLLFDQGKRQFDAFQYDESIPLFDRLITTLTAGGQVQRPELLVQAYELRARARFALGNATGAEQDFSSRVLIGRYRLNLGESFASSWDTSK